MLNRLQKEVGYSKSGNAPAKLTVTDWLVTLLEGTAAVKNMKEEILPDWEEGEEEEGGGGMVDSPLVSGYLEMTSVGDSVNNAGGALWVDDVETFYAEGSKFMPPKILVFCSPPWGVLGALVRGGASSVEDTKLTAEGVATFAQDLKKVYRTGAEAVEENTDRELAMTVALHLPHHLFHLFDVQLRQNGFVVDMRFNHL